MQGVSVNTHGVKDRNPVRAFTALLQAFRPSLWTNRGSLLTGVLVVAFFATAAPANGHFVPGKHNAKHALVGAWCGSNRLDQPCWQGAQALQVGYCESKYDREAENGQYLGLMQMGSSERRRFGHGPDPWTQAEAAHRYYLLSGWWPWSCARIVGLL
jgi:hypothetical protein